jgi:hypothetical protein
VSFTTLLAAADSAVRTGLGGAVTYTPTVGDAVEVDGVFDEVYVRVDAMTPGISSTGPAVFLTLADLPSSPVTDLTATVTIGGTTYLPHTTQPDGQGGVLLLLHRT